MRTGFGYAVLVLATALSAAGCAGKAEAGKPAEQTTTAAAATPSPKPQAAESKRPEPRTPGEFLDRAQEAMSGGHGWTFAVKGKEDLTAQGQTNAASYTAMVQLTPKPDAFHQKGVSTSKGNHRSEEIFVIGDTAYLKEAGTAWTHSPVTDPDTQSKVENPVLALRDFGTYLNNPADHLTMTKNSGEVQLQVTASSKRFPEVQNRDFMKKVKLELDPTLKQLKNAGVPVNDSQLTLSHLEDTLTLDPATHRITSHRFTFSVVIPYGQQGIVYSQDVREDSRGTFTGEIRLPAGVR
ncbi:hypothetical protein [Actinacidiphila acididurans]|uniref:Lipoprotein n=1 Tax=Actinacidiphila acididurans TaxID=2784346 RepID=A0ABS2U3Y3_9ACTN|nr:hypothetical protein [Actinacidiphila acididurans]MBM9509456.1 hypothetical protein [Actinacidiphila acididurans]